MDALNPAVTVARMVPVRLPRYVEHTTTVELLDAAQELVQRLTVLTTASALPGDEAVAWLEQHAECLAIVESLGAGLLLVETPE